MTVPRRLPPSQEQRLSALTRYVPGSLGGQSASARPVEHRGVPPRSRGPGASRHSHLWLLSDILVVPGGSAGGWSWADQPPLTIMHQTGDAFQHGPPRVAVRPGVYSVGTFIEWITQAGVPQGSITALATVDGGAGGGHSAYEPMWADLGVSVDTPYGAPATASVTRTEVIDTAPSPISVFLTILTYGTGAIGCRVHYTFTHVSD